MRTNENNNLHLHTCIVELNKIYQHHHHQQVLILKTMPLKQSFRESN
jgi:hypothetical protein